MTYETKTIKPCVCCKETLIEIDEHDDPFLPWICDRCYLSKVEPDPVTEKGYRQ